MNQTSSKIFVFDSNMMAEKDYWITRLSQQIGDSNLRLDYPRTNSYLGETRAVDVNITGEIYQKLNKLTGNSSFLLYTTLMTTLQICLHKYTGNTTIVVGSPARGKSQSGNLVFCNALAIVEQVERKLSFRQLLLNMRQTLLDAYKNQHYPFERLVQDFEMEYVEHKCPLFDVALVLTDIHSDLPSIKNDVTMTFSKEPELVTGHIEFNSTLFKLENIERFSGHFINVLRNTLENTDVLVSELRLATEAEQHQLLVEWNNTKTAYPYDKCIHELFESQVEKNASATAVEFQDEKLSYFELNASANSLAYYLQTLGVGPEVLVGICVERSWEMVMGVLGILKAGGAYVPLDPEYPKERLSFILADAGVSVLLTMKGSRQKIEECLSSTINPTMVYLDSDWSLISKQDNKNPSSGVASENLAYVIYTSGTTGKPKGVPIIHRSLCNLANAQTRLFDVQPNSRVLQFASFSFDASVWELFMALASGATLCLDTKEALLPGATLTQLLNERAITHVTLPPSTLAVLPSEGLSALRYLIVAGEACPGDLVAKWSKGRQFFNAYGPTETTVCATIVECGDSDRKPPIGRPIDNTQVYVLDPDFHPVPVGVPGELYIGGVGLSPGYLNRPKLTKEKFIEVELFGKTERIYQTGDLARWLPDGHLEYIGRIDFQVKLRGFRIELSEIEAVLSQHEAVKEAVVILYEADDNKRLVAYITTATDSKVELIELKDWLKAQLPDYMIPSHFTVLEQLPLTPNGKIDHKALPAPEMNLTEAYEAPRNNIEQQLAQIWSSLLKQKNISIHNNFFELGGDSILSVQVVAGAHQAGLQLTTRDLFEHQTIAELATAVRFGVELEAEQGLVTGLAPLTPIQQWFFEQELPEYWHFNQSLLLRVPTDLNIDALRQAFLEVLSHHDALRLRYTEVDGHWQQSFSTPTDTVPLVVEDLSSSFDPVADLYKLTQHYQTSLNLQKGPLTYLVLLKWHHEARLFWCIHHLAVDGVSWRILLEDLQTAYQQIVAGQRLQLPTKTSSFKAWAEHLADYATSDSLASEFAYWQALPTFSLPVDNKTGENRLEHHQDYTIALTVKETEALLKKVPAAYNTRINDVLLTALALALTEWTKTDRCLIDLERHGRVTTLESKALDLSRTVGWFTSIHPLVLTLPTRTDLGTALKAIKEQLRGIPYDGIGYGLLTHKSGKVLPKGEILFNYLGQLDAGVEGDDFTFATELTGSDVSLKGVRDHLIDINGAINQGQLSLNWSYSGECYFATTIQTLAERYKIHLQQLIAHCQNAQQGVTPSDFPLAQVTQATLDALVTRYADLQDLYSLSPMQQGMLFHTLYEPSSGVYFEQMQWTLSHLDTTAFKAAWQHQLERHPVLRTAFLTDHTLQVVQGAVSLPWREHDWRGFATDEQRSQLKTLKQQERNQGFDLEKAPLMRFDLIQLDEQRYVFIQHFHHILMDGWCLPLWVSEVRDSYLAYRQGQTPQLPTLRPYRDYIAWLQQQDQAAALKYWQQRLAGFAAKTPLSIVNHQTEAPLYRDVRYVLSATNTQQLQRFSQGLRVTLNTVVQGAFALLLSRYSRESSVCFGVTVSGRHAPLSGIEQMIGLFINTLPLRIEANLDESVTNYLLQIQTQHQNDNRYAHSPLFEIQKVSSVPNGTALFDSLLVFENYPLGNALEQHTDAFQIEEWEGIEYTNYPLTVTIVPGESLEFKVSYDSHRIDFDAIERMWGHLKTLLTALVKNPEQSISQLPMLTEKETKQLLAFNDTKTDYPLDKTIVDLFEQQVSITPDNIAVVFENLQLSYRELNEKANQLAHYLLSLKTGTDNCSLNPSNCLIAIVVERSLEMVIGLLGILKAGGAYVPIDPSYPAARIQYMLEDSAAPLVLTQSQLKAQLPLAELEHECVMVCLDEVDLASQPFVNPKVNCRADNLAYVIYTSGSTGKPKGVMVEHHNLSNFLLDMQQRTFITTIDKLLAVTTLSFDIAALELYLPLISGSRLYLATRTAASDGLALQQQLIQHDISFMQATPATWQLLKQSGWIINIPLNIICGGEALSPELANYLLENSKYLWNVYGPTETTIWSSSYPIQTILNTYPPIGHPIANTRIYILDVKHQPQPLGIPGELCIAGRGLARGYLNRPELTREKFIEVELFGKTERIYQTGDLARWLPDGHLEYIGRIDFQVKLRGFRIELLEIEAVLSQHEAVKEAVVTLYEADDNKRLVAYITIATDSKVELIELKDWLKARLPDYMIPSHLTVLEQLPLTENGKIDRQALPAPSIDFTIGTSLVSPTEELLASLWAGILKRETISRHDNFFELGGHSLTSTQLTARIRDTFQVELPVRVVFEHPLLFQLALEIEAATREVSLPPISKQPVTKSPVLSYAQQRLWFLNQFFDTDNAIYNMPTALRLQGDLSVTALQSSLHWLLQRHESLRCAFPTQNGQALVQILDLEHLEILTIHDLTKLSSEAQVVEVQNRANRHAIAPYDLAQGPLFKVELLLLDKQQSVLLLNMHHIISDGWSMGVFIRDWQHAYTAFAQGIEPSKPPLLIQYSDYAVWQRDWLQGTVLQQQVDYWREQLTGAPELLELPTDKPRPPKQSHQGAFYAQHLSPTLSLATLNLSRENHVSLFMTLLTTFDILLSRYSRQNDISVGSPIANRTHSQTEDIIGFFVNTLVLRSQIQPQLSFIELLQENRKTCLEAYAHQDIPFDMLVEQLQPTRNLSHSPLFQVMFVLQNNDTKELTLPSLEITALAPDYPIAKFDLTLTVEEQNGELYCLWGYATDLFYPETIERMASHFEVLLTALLENPEQSISQLPMLTEKETKQLLTFNDTKTDYPLDKTIVDLFEQQVEKTPSNIAVVFENQQLTYQQLNDKANQLAHHLLTLKPQAGINSSNPLIAIMVERSLEMAIGLLGILKAGCAYVPIDPSYPSARIQYMLEDSAASLLLLPRNLKVKLSLEGLTLVGAVICLDEADFANQPTDNPLVNRFAHDLAYVIYTSGSTGKPKGVMIEHKALSNYVFHIHQHFVHEGRFAWLSTLAADLGNTIIFGALSSGGTLCVIDQQCALDARCLNTAIKQYEIDYLKITPTHLMSLQTPGMPVMPARLLIVGGEASSVEWINTLRQQYPHCQILNHYGPTEATVGVTTYLIEGADSQNTMLPIGKPISNTHIYILDKTGQPLPSGIPGELCIAGKGLARGYLNRPELTRDKFIEVELFGKTERIYQTGDLARWLPSGHLEYIGRIDSQVKLRGFRIELGEIETVLKRHEAVTDAAVTLYEADDNKRLVAYITTATDSKVELIELKNWLKARLPDYMIPSHFTVLEQLPLNQNGKIDKKALPAPDSNTQTENTLPRDFIELQLLSIWETVLDVHPLGIHDNFFELGGHSLLAVNLMSHIQQQCDVRLPVSALFQSPTVATIAQQLRQDTTPLLTNLVPIQTKGEAIPLYGLPGTIGSVMYLYPLASYLGIGQPFYALQTPLYDGSSKTPETVKSLAKYHLQALRQQQRSGPYQLIGHSAGGRVAFEMAWQLEQQGETVALLAILDTNAPNSNQPNPTTDYTDLNWLSNFVSGFEELIGVNLNLSLEHLQTLPDLETAYTQVMQSFQQQDILFAPEAPVDELKALVNTYRITVQAHISYQIPGKLHCPIYLFRASEQRPNLKFKETREAWGWSECTHAKVEELMVPGTHNSMMTRPHVKTLADTLSQYLPLR